MHSLFICQCYDPCFTPLSLKGALQNKEEIHRVNPWMHFYTEMILKQCFEGKVVVPGVCICASETRISTPYTISECRKYT